MKRVVIFASYSKNGILADYVLYYLQGLKKIAEDIVFISDSKIQQGEEKKIQNLTTYYKCEQHGCYDFGSYRRGFEWVENNGLLNEADELIFCNDSCYGPVYPFEDIFVEMSRRNCDFWGITGSRFIRPHIQSFFMTFKKKVFDSSAFKKFVHSFEKQSDFWGYVNNYETQFMNVLEQSGFHADTYIDINYFEKLAYNQPTNPMLWPIENIEKKMPLLKRKVFQNYYDGYLIEPLSQTLYNLGCVNKDLFDIVKKDMAENDLQFLKILGVQQKRENESRNEIQRYNQKLEKKNNKHLKQLRFMIYTNILLIVLLLAMIVYWCCRII